MNLSELRIRQPIMTTLLMSGFLISATSLPGSCPSTPLVSQPLTLYITPVVYIYFERLFDPFPFQSHPALELEPERVEAAAE
jgi:hypothetical protein